MKVVKVSDIKAQESNNKIFSEKGGKVNMQDIIGENNDDLRAAIVHFSPGAGTTFHTHTFDQILYVTEGTGIVATEQKEVTVTPGAFIFIPTGERHWHGATKDTTFSHLYINPPGETNF